MFKLIILLCIVATTSGFVGGSSYVDKIPLAYPSTRKSDDGYALLSSINNGDDIDISRRAVLHGTIVVLSNVCASQAQAAKLRPDDAYANLGESYYVLTYCHSYTILISNPFALSQSTRRIEGCWGIHTKERYRWFEVICYK